jgi:hypothetical protein
VVAWPASALLTRQLPSRAPSLPRSQTRQKFTHPGGEERFKPIPNVRNPAMLQEVWDARAEQHTVRRQTGFPDQQRALPTILPLPSPPPSPLQAEDFAKNLRVFRNAVCIYVAEVCRE